MSSIIIDKLKQIDKASRDEKHSYTMTASSSAESTFSEKKRKKSIECKSSYPQSSYQTSSAMVTDESEYYEAYHVAKVWAGKLRKLRHCQKLYAEKAIHDILFEAQLGHLHKSSVKINGKSTVTSRTPSTSSRSSYTSKSTNSTPLDSSLLERSHSEKVEASSEVLISEAYPNENALLSTESHTDHFNSKDNLVKINTAAEHTRNQTFIVAASPNTVMQVSSKTGSAQGFENQEDMDKNSASNAATNTPECILKQLSISKDCYEYTLGV